MIKFVFVIISCSCIFGQNTLEKQSPCSHPLIKLANDNGIKSIPLKDIFKYRSLVKECKSTGNSKVIEQIEMIDWERDFKRSKSMSSWTSTHAMFVVVTVGYYYMAKVLDVPYEVTFFPK
tara:strand:- start:128 stop:487 length:360 start_codon:yes stop_codon:yes gene_type:complete